MFHDPIFPIFQFFEAGLVSHTSIYTSSFNWIFSQRKYAHIIFDGIDPPSECSLYNQKVFHNFYGLQIRW